ncbi:hypothetical protein F4782DRAFT_539591 [Xylaria castorea]|nr:hypothetical protein F4782DRAFT_539591 [Xylaria castorea]
MLGITHVNSTGALGRSRTSYSSIYRGNQIIPVEADNKSFSGGSPWKRLTCGLDYPHNILECNSFDFSSDRYTPERLYKYPIRWNTAADELGEGGTLRELRTHPDDVHTGFYSFSVAGVENLGQYAYVGRLVTGEFRGFSESGKEFTYIGYPKESSNIEVFAVEIATEPVRRLTSHQDPVDISSNDDWIAIMDTRGTDQYEFIARSFLLDRYVDRGDYYGQRINNAGDGRAGSFDGSLWSGRAHPKAVNSLSCQTPIESDGRNERSLIAHSTERQLKVVQPVALVTENIPWGTPYEPSASLPLLKSGHTEVVFTEIDSGAASSSIAVTYSNFSHHGQTFQSGYENVTSRYPSVTLNIVYWSSKLVQRGETQATRIPNSQQTAHNLPNHSSFIL